MLDFKELGIRPVFLEDRMRSGVYLRTEPIDKNHYKTFLRVNGVETEIANDDPMIRDLLQAGDEISYAEYQAGT